MNDYTTILVDQHNQVGLVRFNRPQVMNALNDTMLNELMTALEKLDADQQIGALVIAGNEQVFAAGADIKQMAQSTPMEMFLQRNIDQFDRIRGINKPVIAAVSGWCLGGGCELALSCDMIVAAETARFGQPEITIGVIPGAGGTQRLTRAVGKAIAMEIVLNNRTLTAEEALRLGMINRVVPVERYLDAALELAKEIAGRAPLAIRLAKEVINNAFETSLSDGLTDERRSFYLLFSTQDQREGMEAFINKRSPIWRGK